MSNATPTVVAVQLRNLTVELDTLRAVHAGELEAVRRAAQEEHERLREWCGLQLRAVEEAQSRREATRAGDDSGNASGTQLARVVAEHRKQQAALRKLLDDETERCAAARAEVLAVSIAAGNERLALHAELARARRAATSRAADATEGVKTIRAEADEREASLRRQLRAAERRVEEQAATTAKALAEAAQQTERESALVAQLRKEVAALSTGLRAAQAAASKADARAAKATDENANLAAGAHAAEQQIHSLKGRLAMARPGPRRMPSKGKVQQQVRGASVGISQSF